MYVFGGRSDYGGEIFTNHEIYCNKIQVFDTSTSTWMEPVTYGIQPIGRRSHSACKSSRLLCLDLFIALYWSFCKLNFTIDSLISLILFSCKTTLCIGNLTFCKHLQIKLTIELFQFLHALNVKFCINLCKNELWT